MTRIIFALGVLAVAACGSSSDTNSNVGVAGSAGAPATSAGSAGASAITAGAGGSAIAGQGGFTGHSASGSAGAAGAATCDPSAIAGLAVAPSDVYAYAPYALDGCRLAFVDAAGALHLRDLAAGTDAVIATADEAPRRPSIAGNLVAWEAQPSVVRLYDGAATTTVSGAFDHAGEPRASASGVVFTAWMTADDDGDTDVWVASTDGAATPVVTAPAQQRFADISATMIAYTDFAEDPSGTFQPDSPTDLADVVVVDRTSGQSQSFPKAGKQGFPLLGSDGHVVYLQWSVYHPEPKLSTYEVRSFDLAADFANSDRSLGFVANDGLTFDRPATFGGVAYLVTGSTVVSVPVGGGNTNVIGTSQHQIHVPVGAANAVLAAETVATADALRVLQP